MGENPGGDRNRKSEARSYLWDGGLLTIGQFAGTGFVATHAHHAIQISIGLDRPTALRHPEGPWVRAPGVVVSADVPHQLDAGNGLLGLLFVDPEAREGRWLARTYRAPIESVPDERLRPAVESLQSIRNEPRDELDAARLIHTLVRGLCTGPRPPYELHPRIRRAIDVIHAMDTADISLETVARAVHLSASRFAHLFRDETGVPFRRYLLWRRLTSAMLDVGSGHTLSAAARRTGFTDSADLTRASVRMFGQPPSVLAHAKEFHEIPAPFAMPT